jgi:hypothetical protein
MRCCVCANSALVKGKWICAHGDYCSQRLSVFPTRLALRFANFMLYLGYDAASAQALRK